MIGEVLEEVNIRRMDGWMRGRGANLDDQIKIGAAEMKIKG